MKKYLVLCLSLCISVLANAQATDLVVDCQTPGWLSSKINYGDQQTVKNLKVTGYLNGTDINFLVHLQSEYKLRSLDLSETNIVRGGEKVFISSYYDDMGHLQTIEQEIQEDNVLYSYLFLPFTNLHKISTPNSFNATEENLFEKRICINADTVIVNGKFKSIQMYSEFYPGKSSHLPSYIIKSLEITEGVDSISIYAYSTSHSTSSQLWEYQRIVLPSSISKIADLNIKGGNIVSKIEHPEIVSFINCTRIEGDTIFVPQGTSDNYRKSKFSTLKVIREMSIPNSLTLNHSKLKMYKNDAITLLASFTPEDAFYKELKWESNNESIAKVNQFGEVSAVSPGIADITVSSVKNPEAKAICTVSVYEHTTGVNISDDNIVVCINETKQLTANTLPLGTTDNEVTWASSDEEIATVDVNGKVTGVKPGSCIIKATTVDGGFEAQCNVTVVQLAETITLNKESTSLIVGKTETLTANILPDNTTDKTILWSSSNINVATVDANGMITAKKAGECTITATSLSNPNVTATCKVTVIQPVTGITLNKTTIEMSEVGEQNQLIATISPEDATEKSVTWSSTNNQICSVSATGIVTATGAGTAIVTATTVDGGLTANCVVKVLQHVDGLNLNKTATSLKVGESEKLQPTITPSNADNKKVIWTSSDSNVATVDTEGNVTAVKAGQVTITATSEDNTEAKATCTVTVIQPVTGISLSESSYKLKAIGENIQLTATVLPEDATNKKVNWNCPNNTVCIVSNGNVVAVGYGTAVIIATTEDGGFVATCTITVEDTSGIIEVKSDHNDNLPTYDTMGRKVQELKKGQLYIRQGKKFVVK